MKYYKRLNLYKASNVSYNPTTKEAKSWDWWVFVKVINNKVVFNGHRYSVSTGRHQSKVRRLLHNQYVTIDFYIDTVESLNSSNALPDALSNIKDRIDKGTDHILNKRTRPHTKKRAYESIKDDIIEYNALKAFIGVDSEAIDPSTLLRLKRLVDPCGAFEVDLKELIEAA